MIIILLITTIIYGYKIKKDGMNWSKTILYSVLIFVISRFIGLLFQSIPQTIIKDISDGFLILTAMIIPAILYIVIPNVAYKKKWFKK